ncbi:MAG: TlpA disulfide reductase family protein [Pseudomonadota bacterium]
MREKFQSLTTYKKLSLLITSLFLVGLVCAAALFLSNKNEIIVVAEAPSEISEQKLTFDFRKKQYFDDPQDLPDISFLNPQGQSVTWSDFVGTYTLINVWATWCSPCVIELPTLEKLGDIFKDDGLRVIAISIDMTGDQERLRAFLDKRNISDFALYFDQERLLQKSIQMRGIPTTFLLNPEGKLIRIFEGEANWSAPPAVDYFNKLLNENYSDF